MKITAYFNEKFVSSGDYVKVCIELAEDNGNYIGMFSAISNIVTGKVQVQRYLYSSNGGRNFFNIAGRNRQYLYTFDEFKRKWNSFSSEIQHCFNDCIIQLPRSSRRFFEIYNNASSDEKKQVRDFIFNEILPEKWRNATENNEAETVIANVKEWQDVNLNAYSSEELTGIIDAISKANNPKDGVEYNGEEYRILEDENGCAKIQVCTAETVNDEDVDAPAPVPENTRKFIQMVKMIDVNGLTEFVVGNFYPVIEKLNKNGKDYFSIKLNDTESRVVSAKRVKVVNVFTESPA